MITFYERRLLNEPQIEKELSDIYWGFAKPHDIKLELLNNDGFFSDLFNANEEFRRKPIILKIYDGNEDIADQNRFELYGIITAYNILLDKATFNISVNDPDPLKTLLPKKLYENSDWTEIPPTITNPASDLGKPYPLIFGRVSKVTLRYVHSDTISDYYDYIVGYTGTADATESNNTNKATTIVVYRNKVIVASSEYTVYDGSQASPYPGYAFIRFILEQRDFSGNLYELHADFRGLRMGGATAERNFANIIKQVLNNSEWGLNQSINTASFATAATAISNLYCDGIIAEQKTVQDIIDELLYLCHGKLTRNEAGEWELTIDTLQQMIKTIFAHNDNNYNNIIEINNNCKTSTDNVIKDYILKYKYNEWESEYMFQNKRTIFAFGEDQTHETQFVRDHTTADRITCYVQKLFQNGDHHLEITVGMEARLLNERDLVQINIPDLKINNKVFQINSINKNYDGNFNLKLMGYSSDIYVYTIGTIPNDENADNETDWSNTVPATPTSFSLVSWESVIGLDGTTFQAAKLQATAPTINFTHMIFAYKLNSGDTYTYFEGEGPISGYIWKGRTPALTPGQSYDFVAIAVNTFNLRSLAAILTAQVAPGDTTAPAQVTDMVGSGKYKTWHFSWTANSEDDLKSYHVQIGSSGFVSVYFDKYIGANSVDFTDDARGYGTLYCRVKAVDFTGNESASWSATASATTAQTQTGDIGGDQINYSKRQLVESQSIAINIPASSGASYIFSHNLGRKPLITMELTTIAVQNLVCNINTDDTNIDQFGVVLINLRSYIVTGTLTVIYW